MFWPFEHPLFKRKKSKRDERDILMDDIRKAQHEWKLAQIRLEYVKEHDEIDCAIFALEAAEKRYEMLLRQAKRENVSADVYKLG